MNNSAQLRLDADAVEQYRDRGYLLYREPVFAPAKFERLKAIFEEDLALYGENGLDTIHFRDARLLEFLLSEEVLDLIVPLVGPNIGLWSSHFISKPAGVGRATPWHEDSAYWNGRISTMEGICTLWLAIDSSSTENGCMQVIPGTHVNGFSDYTPVNPDENIFNIEIKGEQVDVERAVAFELEPNQCSFHEARIIHGAQANTSTKRRAGYTMRYFPTTSRVYPEKNDGHKLWLARGRDIAGNVFEN
jgi:hypothetical protein